ncbi:hypothetical protein ACLOJK_010212 [Asimina triloba]
MKEFLGRYPLLDHSGPVVEAQRGEFSASGRSYKSWNELEGYMDMRMAIGQWPLNLLDIFCAWDAACMDGHGRVLFDALDAAINETAMQALQVQGRDVTHHLRDIWREVVKSWLKEAEWGRSGYRPSVAEYLKNASVSCAPQTSVLSSMYLVGPILTEELTNHTDYKKLTNLLMLSCRLLNDVQTYEVSESCSDPRYSVFHAKPLDSIATLIDSTPVWGTCDVMQKESKEGTPNLVLLLMQGKLNSRIEDVSAYISKILDRTKHELVEHVLMDDKNCVPKPCRRLHLNVTTIFQMFYNSANVFDSATALVGSINKAFYDPFSSLGMPSPEQIYEQVEPCLYHATDKGAKPTKGCCDGVKQLLGRGKPRPFEFVYWAETAHSNYSRSRGRWNCHLSSSIQVRGLCTLTVNYSQGLGFWVFRFWVCVPSMDRRSIASRFTLLTRRFRPFVAQPVFHDDDNEQHHLPRRIASKPQTNYFLGHGFYKNYTNTTAGICSLIQARGGFVPSRNLCLGPSHSYSTSTVGDGSDKIECLADVVDVFVEKSAEVVATQAPVANEVAVAAADSYLPVAVLQYTIDGIHSIIGAPADQNYGTDKDCSTVDGCRNKLDYRKGSPND